jgi:hypothetical protein
MVGAVRPTRPRAGKRLLGAAPDSLTNHDQIYEEWGYVSSMIPLDRIAIREAEKRKTGFALSRKMPFSLQGRHSGVISGDQKSQGMVGHGRT